MPSRFTRAFCLAPTPVVGAPLFQLTNLPINYRSPPAFLVYPRCVLSCFLSLPPRTTSLTYYRGPWVIPSGVEESIEIVIARRPHSGRRGNLKLLPVGWRLAPPFLLPVLLRMFLTKPSVRIIRHPYPPKLPPLSGLIILRRNLRKQLRQLHPHNPLFILTAKLS